MTPKNPAAPYYADAAPDDQPAAASPTISWPAATATLQAAALASCIRICWIARRGRAPHGGANGPLLRPDQLSTRKILRGCEQARRRRARIRDLFDRRRLRPAGEILRRREDGQRPFRQREGADDPGHPRYAPHHPLQGVLRCGHLLSALPSRRSDNDLADVFGLAVGQALVGKVRARIAGETLAFERLERPVRRLPRANLPSGLHDALVLARDLGGAFIRKGPRDRISDPGDDAAAPHDGDAATHFDHHIGGERHLPPVLSLRDEVAPGVPRLASINSA